ncbi:hypothetical protein BDV98DRAFT_337176 [Pterulicium gracile]|uniref:Uncharacterized protein n=1 Tax=Pterulicium gracile TaxID=1884261 RepID=A0A5C3Q2C0_9AGAR|nr:hypothetical protein BDV98DRAFT_337176 [Pterula gracilis]
MYLGLASMLLDSSPLYTMALIVAYTALPGNGGTWSLYSPLVAQTEALAVELIILRITLGHSITKEDVVIITSAHPNRDCEGTQQLNSSSSIATPRRVRIRETIQSTFSQFPSSVAAVLRSNRGEETRTGSVS